MLRRDLSAGAIARRHASSSAIADALNPSRGIRDDIARRGGTPRDHARDNARNLKVLAAQVRAKREAQEQREREARAPPPTKQRYSHVPSRLQSARTRGESASGGDEEAYEEPVLRPSPVLSSRSTAAAAASRRGPPSAPAPPVPVPARPIARSASSSSLSSAAGAGVNPVTAVPERRTRIGEVPAYLRQRQDEWARVAEEKRQRQIEKETWPPGTVPVPEEERLETLRYLQQSHKELVLELSRFPITLTPASVQKYKRQQEVLAKLREVEKGIEVYSQDRVFMAKVDA